MKSNVLMPAGIVLRRKLFTLAFLLASVTVFGQLSGVKNIPGDYISISAAVAALNGSSVGAGGVIFNVAAGYTETIPLTITITATGTSANPIVFQKDPLTSGPNPLITAYEGGLGTPSTAQQNGIWRMVGSDYITIDGIDLSDNPLNTSNPSTMEYGYALYKASTSNGCQYVTIKNCVITLNSINNEPGTATAMVDGSTGIIVLNTLPDAATTPIVPVAGGTNSNNAFYSNTIQNCNTGIALIGYVASAPFTLADVNNDVGGSSVTTGNTIINFGGAQGAIDPAAAVRTLAQYGLNVSYNTINNNNGAGVNHANVLRGIYINTALSANTSVTYNTITLKGGGTTQAVTGIENAAGATPAANTISISNNTITNSTYTTATTGAFYGINNVAANPATLSINQNVISNNSSAATLTGSFYGILNSGVASAVNMNANTFTGNSTADLTTGLFVGIYNTASAPVLNINNNTLAGNFTTALAGVYYAIYNTGTVTGTININANNIGTVSSPAINFTAANSGSQVFINNTKGGVAAALSISNNNFYNVLYSVAGTGPNTFISNAGGTFTQDINSNTFNNLNVNTAGSVVFISNSGVVPASGIQHVNSNSISGTFTKAGGATITLFSGAATSVSGSVINHNNNNFSNITVTGATTIAGWAVTDAGVCTRTIQNNTFSNWAGGTSGITAMTLNLTNPSNAITGNAINNISGAGAITGISLTGGSVKAYSNIINTLSSTGAAAAVTGISASSGTSQDIYKNKIYDLLVSVTGGTVNGISVSGTTSGPLTVNIFNNLIGDLRTPAGNVADPVRGISITSTKSGSAVNVYYNTIYLNATSSGALFGTSGIFHAASATSTIAALNLRNNIVINTSTPNGAGLTVALRRSAATLANYVSTSNNNLFYAGAPGPTRLIHYNGTNADPTLLSYKARVAPSDAQSVSEDLITSSKFLSVLGSSSSFLHLDPSKANFAESGAANITGFVDDYDAQPRQGNSGYSGTGTAPDIGADEMEGTRASVPSGTYNVGAGQTFTSLTKAGGLFATLNSLGLTGNVVVNITSDLDEDGSNALFQWAEQGGPYTVTIQPDGATLRTISGNVVGGLIRLNGATRLTIDGSAGTTGRYLTFRNTNTPATTGTAFTFINGATNNTIKNTNIEAFGNSTNGVILFSTSTITGGNSNNTINNCSVNGTVSGNSSNVSIYSAGTATAGFQNAANVISNNNIYNYRDRGLDISASGSTGWVITGNSFYNGDVSAANYAAASLLHGIRILGGAGYAITGNYIGGNLPLAAGTNAVYSSTGILSYQGILLTTTGATPLSRIEGNTIASISISANPSSTTAANVFIGIETNGSGINIGGTTAGLKNTIGSNSVNGSILITTTTVLATYKTLIRGINCLSTGGLVSFNQVAGIDIKNIGPTSATAASSSFLGIYVNGVTAPSQVNNNIIGSTGAGAAANSIRVLNTSTSTTTGITGISIGLAVTSAVTVSGNTIQNFAHQSPTASGAFTGISNAATGAAVIVITNNIITANVNNATTGGFYGIYHNGSPAAVTITNNTISNNTSTATTTGFLYGVYTAGVPVTLAINNNTFSGNTTAALTTGLLVGIYNAATTPVLNINNNTLAGNSTSALSGAYYAIYNAGAVTATININANNIGTAALSAITFTAANSGVHIFINNTAGTGTAALSISNNNFQSINYAVAGTGANTFILNAATTLSQTIDGNTFTNLNVNTSGAITFISDNVVVLATGSQSVSNNSIVTGFTKRATGTVTLFTSSMTSLANSVVTHSGNNFSNITVTGATTIAGWVNTDLGGAAKTIQNNTFSNWVGGTNPVTVIAVNLSGVNKVTRGNLINAITGANTVTGITTGAGNDLIYSNTINGLSSTGAFAVTGIAVTTGTAKSIYANKIYDLSTSNAAGTVNGILVSGGLTVTVYNNLIGDLRATTASAADPVRGISVTSAVASSNVNIYYNTIYLNASSSGLNFGTSGIFHAANATSTTAALSLINNSITNTSTPRGTGLTVAYRRSGTALNNYSATSNNNLFFSGTPSATRVIFYDGTTSDPTIAQYRTRVATRDSESVTEDLTAKFASTTGSSALFLHMDITQPTLIESGAVNIDGFADDFDVQPRAGSPGYTGPNTSPDIGADEVLGIEAEAPTITYTPLADVTATTNRNVTGITITDESGLNNNAGAKPRIYFKRSGDANAWIDNTSRTNGWKYTEATNASSPYTFTINYALLYGESPATAGVIQYFIVAQDLATVANVAINSGTFNAAPATVALTSAAFPIGGTINNYRIPFSGNYRVGTGEAFTSLTRIDGLFAAIDSAGLMGNATVSITSDLTEDGVSALNQWTESGVGNYTLTIRPDAAVLRTVSGSAAGGLIRLDGADRVTIDGSIGGVGNFLRFKNTHPAGTTGTALTFVNGAANNSIRYCDLQAYANATNGVVLFSTSTGAGGNSNNLIDNCTISATVTTLPGNTAIYSAGTIGKENSGNTISNNSVEGFRDRGLDIAAAGSTAWSISGNSFYNGQVTGTINYSAATALHGIRVLGGSGYSILNNHIGGSQELASGANAVYSSTLGNLSYEGILLSTTSASPASHISGNTIASISLFSVPTAANSNAFTGIETSGSGINIGGTAAGEGNIIGSGTGNGYITVTTTTTITANTSLVTGIYCSSTGGLVTGNQVGGMDISNIGSAPAPSLFRGIYVTGVSAPSQVNSNLIGSGSTSNSIRVLPASASTTLSLTGIEIGTAVNAPIQVTGNSIQNFGNLSTTSSGSFTGINNTATLSGAIITISSDTIQFVNSGSNSNPGSTIYSGILSSSPSTISNNVISDITLLSSGVNAQVKGMQVSGPYAHTISGNIVAFLSTSSNKVIAGAETGNPALSAIIGLLNIATADGQVINNNRFLGFSATSGAGINVAVTGLGVNGNASGNIFNNRFGTMINLATGSGPLLCHIMAASGSFNAYNNNLAISNLTNTNALKVYGIIHASGTNWNYFHNTVRVGGSSNGTAFRSTAFLLSGNSSPVLKNNIFFNIRTGTGTNYAVSNLASPATTWLATASDYNDFFSINPNTVGEWGNGISKTFAEWQVVSGGNVHSISNAISFITTPYDLEPDSISNCNFNNAGIAITSPIHVDTDINNRPRDAVSPDLGAYEFHYVGFTIIAGSNAPVCAGDSVTLSVDPGDAISPSYSWRNPANVLIATAQYPVIASVPGMYKVTVTDSTGCYVTDSVLVTINPRPTATITATASVCDSAIVNLNIHVTGSGVISGTLSSGEVFSGTAPLIVVPVFITTTTAFSIESLSDSSCSAIPTDIPDTITVAVTRKGDWLGITSNWNDPVNWCGGMLPTSSTNITIPAGSSFMPVISDSVYSKDLMINAGASVTITATGHLNIAGTLTNIGTFTDNGTTNFNGTSGQQSFSGIALFHNLTINSTGGLLLPGSVVVNNLTISTGILSAASHTISIKGNWTNNASVTAFVAGSGTVTFNGTTPQSVNGSFATTFNDLTTSNTVSTVSLAINASIGGNLLVSGGAFDLGAYTANRTTVGGALTVANNAILKIGGTNTFPLNFTSVTLVVASTVEYSGTNQVVFNQTYGNLALSSSGGASIKTFPATALTVLGNLTSTQGTGTSVSFTAASNINVDGNINIGASTTFNGGSYLHTIGGNWINSGTFTGNTSTVIFSGSGAAVSGTGMQNFNNLTVAASGVIFSSNSTTLTGNLVTTGSGSFSQALGGTLVMSGTGKTISGFGISLNNLVVNGSVTTSTSLQLTGNLSVSGSFAAGGGTITMSGSSKNISGSGSIAFYSLSPTGSVTTNNNFSITSGLVVSGSFSASAGTATFTGASSLSGTANLFNININGTSLKLSAGSVLGIANILTITSGTLDATTSGPNTVNFNGSGNQIVNGITYSHIIMSNGGTKTAAGAITTAFDITIGTGTAFNPGSFTHTTYGNWINNGTFIPGTSTILFLGPANGFISGPTVFNILTINTDYSTTEIILKDNISVSTVNMTNGIILTESDTLTITGTRTGIGFIRGNIQRTHAFISGVAYAFEGPENTITFSAVSSVSSIIVSIVEEPINDFPFGGSIGRLYDIHVPTGTYNATLRLHYEDDELNGNNESSMALWHYNGSSWSSIGKTANDSTSNYVEHGGLTDITNRWTCSDDGNLVQWNGSVSSDWNTAENWTVLQGAGSRPPSSSDIVDLGTAAFVNQPIISSNVTVKNIIFGSVQAVTLTLGSGGSLTTLGDINGTWSGNATHTINVNDQSLSINGNIDLSDGINGHAINLNIGSGAVTTLGSLEQSGGANINFVGTGALNIFIDFNYSSGVFTPGGGTVTYNGNENQHIAHVNYSNLTINKTGGFATITDTVNIGGNLIISAGELDNFSATTIAGSVTIDAGGSLNNSNILHVQGNWNNNGTYVSSGSSIFFDGSGTQNISASTFNNFNINKPSGTAILSGEVIVTGDFSLTSGTFDFQTYFVTRNVVGGTATIGDSGVAMIGGNNGPANFATKSISVSSTIIYYGSATQYISAEGISFGNVIFRNGGGNPKILITSATVKGNLSIESGATLVAASYTISLDGNWINNGTFIAATGTVLLNGASKTITGNTTFNQVTASGSYTILNDITFVGLFTISSTGSVSAGTGRTITISGDFTCNGTWNVNGTVIFSGTVVQTINSINANIFVLISNFNGSVSPIFNSTSSPRFGTLNINNTGGVNPAVGWTVLASLTVGTGAIFNGGASSHVINGALTNNGTITSSGTISFIPSSAVTVNLGSNFSSTGTVIFGGSGAMTLAGTPLSFRNVVVSNTNVNRVTPSSNWNISNNFTVNSGAILNAGNFTHFVGGNIANNGSINSGTSTFTLNGAGSQDIYTLSNFNNLTINKASGSTTLSSNTTVNGVLNFVAGRIQTGSNLLIQPSSGTVTGAAQNTGWVNGKLRKNIVTGPIAKSFEVGDAVSYTPVSLVFSNVTIPGDLTAFTTAGDHPNIGSSGVNAAKSVNRFWSLTNSGISFTNYSARFNFVATDIDAGASPASFGVGLYNGSSWIMPVTALPTDTNIQATGVIATGDFVIGEVCSAGTTISYAASPYCSSGGTASVTLTGATGGKYRSTPGLIIDSTTGAVDLAGSTAGTYVVSYNVDASGGCSVYAVTASITITTQPYVEGFYPGNPFCADAGIIIPQGIVVGALGTITGTPGLSIDPNTGVVNINASTPGNHIVTYTVPASGGCLVYIKTGDVTITPVPNATIAYTDSMYCSTGGSAPVTFSGTTGGTYSSTPGLSINDTTGTIDLGASIAETYTVTYTVAAAGGCSFYSTTAVISIHPSPTAVISYDNSPYCSDWGIATVVITGTEGGTYTSTNGLFIDTLTGDINTGLSTPGTYTVTYTLPAGNGCLQLTTTASVTITAELAAIISYSGSPYCTSLATDQPVTHTGTLGGTYSSTDGLSIDTLTGAITPATSTGGTYTVTYTMAAVGGCTEQTATTSITIVEMPDAEISYAGSPYCLNGGTAAVTKSGTDGGTYSSTVGLSLDSLTGAVTLGTSTAGTYTVTYTIAAGGCAQYTTTTSITVAIPGTWTGAVSNDWNTGGNWLCGLIPVSATNVSLRGGLTTYPSIVTGARVNNLTIESGATLTLAGATLQIGGFIANSGTFNAGSGTVEMNGSSAQTIPAAAFSGNAIGSLIINNSSGVTLGGALSLTDVLTVSKGSLASNGYLRLKSSATATARIAPITSAVIIPISGNVTVERYIPGRRKYRLITSSVTTSASTVLTAGQESLSIWGNWQNQGNNITPNSGTLITGGTVADGFDPQTANASLFTYDDVNRRFTGYTSANGKNTKYTPLKAGTAYYMFVYGDRRNSVTTSTPNPTVLAATGTLLTGTQVFNSGSQVPLSGDTGRYTLLGNPFVSPIDWATLPKTDITNTYWGWDPNLSSTGGYVTVSTTGTTTLIAPFSGSTGLNQYIQPGQGFFVRTTGVSPALTIREQDKTSNFNSYAFVKAPGRDLVSTSNVDGHTESGSNVNSIPLLAINLQYDIGATRLLADGVVAAFAGEYSNGVGKEDAFKIPNAAESVAFATGGELLSIDARQMPHEKDTLFLRVNRLTRPQYTLQIFARQLEAMQARPFLQDNYLHTIQALQINDTNRVVFNVTPSDPASSDTNRFRILFVRNEVLPVNFISVTGAQKDKGILVDWKVGAESGIEKYEVERSGNSQDFTKAGEVKAQVAQGTGTYQWLDVNFLNGANYYRIRGLQLDGKYILSKVIRVNTAMVNPKMSIFPNPVKNHQINFRLYEIEKGEYTFLLTDARGTWVDSKTIVHTGESSLQHFRLRQGIPKGLYYLQMSNGKARYVEIVYIE